MVYCTYCGEVNGDNNMDCASCGKKLIDVNLYDNEVIEPKLFAEPSILYHVVAALIPLAGLIVGILLQQSGLENEGENLILSSIISTAILFAAVFIGTLV